MASGAGSAMSVSRCDSSAAALSFLDTLKFSCEVESVAPRTECPVCGKAVRFYCSKCVQSVVKIPEPLDLGVQVLILRHPKEPAAKSSATPLPLLSAEIQVCEWSKDDCSAMIGPGSWLVFPSEDSQQFLDILEYFCYIYEYLIIFDEIYAMYMRT